MVIKIWRITFTKNIVYPEVLYNLCLYVNFFIFILYIYAYLFALIQIILLYCVYIIKYAIVLFQDNN